MTGVGAVDAGPGRPLLEITNATKVYGGGLLQGGEQVVALRDFSMALPEKPASRLRSRI
jgi:hypothetical protein